MRNDQQIFDLYTSVNPVPTGTVDSATDLLERATRVDISAPDSRAGERRSTATRGIVIGVAVAVLILFVGVLNLILGLGAGINTEPVTRPTEEVSLAEGVLESLAAGDVDQFLALLSPEAMFLGWPVADHESELEDRLEFYAAIGLKGEYQCTQNGPEVVICDWTLEDDLGGPTSRGASSLSVVVVNGQAVSIGWEDYPTSERNTFIDDLVAWIRMAHPVEAEALSACGGGAANCWGGATSFRMTAESGGLLMRLAPEYQPSSP